jgi:hypothetical protein
MSEKGEEIKAMAEQIEDEKIHTQADVDATTCDATQTPEEREAEARLERRLKWKIDLVILLLLALAYFLASMVSILMFTTYPVCQLIVLCAGPCRPGKCQCSWIIRGSWTDSQAARQRRQLLSSRVYNCFRYPGPSWCGKLDLLSSLDARSVGGKSIHAHYFLKGEGRTS